MIDFINAIPHRHCLLDYDCLNCRREHHLSIMGCEADFIDAIDIVVYSRVYDRNERQEYMVAIDERDKSYVRFVDCSMA
jgi:hypothetical protein